jgi:rfaE bifunctional protein kinase chain/domain
MKKIINSFKGKKVLIIGDVILDAYIYSESIGDALYARIPEVEEKKTKVSFGGNGLIASNVLELGGMVYLVSVIGDDDKAKYYETWKHPMLKKLFVKDSTRKTTIKKRWFVNNKALLQANEVDNHDISPTIEKKVIKLIENVIKSVDAMVVMDPQHGVLTKSLIKKVVDLSRKYSKPLYVDSQVSHRPSNHFVYKGSDTFILNQKEAKAVYPKFSTTKLENSLSAIARILKAKNIIVKLGPKGSAALIKSKYIRTPTLKVNAVDVCGAGDAFMSAFCLAHINQPEKSLKIANVWATLSTTIHGTIPPKIKDLNKAIN